MPAVPPLQDQHHCQSPAAQATRQRHRARSFRRRAGPRVPAGRGHPLGRLTNSRQSHNEARSSTAARESPSGWARPGPECLREAKSKLVGRPIDGGAQGMPPGHCAQLAKSRQRCPGNGAGLGWHNHESPPSISTAHHQSRRTRIHVCCGDPRGRGVAEGLGDGPGPCRVRPVFFLYCLGRPRLHRFAARPAPPAAACSRVAHRRGDGGSLERDLVGKKGHGPLRKGDEE